MYVCVCNAVSDKTIQEAVANGARTLSDLQAQLGVASCCGCCADYAESYLEPIVQPSVLDATELTPPWKNLQKNNVS